MCIDLHTHTHFSDGSLSPQELIAEAQKEGLRVIAITDHDEVGAIAPALEYAMDSAVRIVPGVELSIDYDLPGRAHLHLLGLFIDHQHEPLIRTLLDLKNARRQRMLEMVDKMRSMGMDITDAEVQELVGQGSPGRPHLARVMVARGIVPNLHAAFVNYLSKGKPAYVPKKKLPIGAAIELIHQAGGLAFLAHPFSLGYAFYEPLGHKILKLKAQGLDGIEVYYSKHSRYFTRWLDDFARKQELLVCGGSDFHGAAKPEIQLGRGLGSLNIPYAVYEKLLYHWQKNGGNDRAFGG